MKIVVAACFALTLAGCAGSSFGGDKKGSVEGIAPPPQGTAIMLTSRPADQVAGCMAAVLGSTAQRDAEGFTLTTAGTDAVTYKVRTIATDRFTTEVDQIGFTSAGPAVTSCALPDRAGMRG